MALDFLTSGSPASTNTNQATQTTLPDWYNAYIQGVAGKATDIAKNPYQAYPGARIADFNDDQMTAFQKVRDNSGNYLNDTNAASATLGGAQGALGQVSGLVGGAQTAVGGPAAQWTDPGVSAKYMSPYTQNVVDEIARLGNRNLTESVIPQVQSNFVGSGQFGSSRNADILARGVRDAQTDISGLQSTALQNGWNTGMGQFNADANRTQQQGSLQAQTALGGANATTSAANAGAGIGAQQGALGQLKQTLGNNEATALGAVGGQQQALEQKGYDTGYQDFLNQQNWDWTQLGKVQGAVQGAQLPTGTSGSTSQASSPASPSPLGWVNAITGLYNATQTPG